MTTNEDRVRCAVCGVARPLYGAIALDFDHRGVVVGAQPVCTFCAGRGERR